MKIELNHPIYNTPVRLRSWNGKVTVVRAASVCLATSCKLLLRLAPHWSHVDHASLSQYHALRAEKLNRIWNLVIDRAALQTFGRPWEVTDYKICAIGREEFSEAHKRVLRHCAYNHSKHADLASVHARLARSRSKNLG